MEERGMEEAPENGKELVLVLVLFIHPFLSHK
jgi:hypothetical protein